MKQTLDGNSQMSHLVDCIRLNSGIDELCDELAFHVLGVNRVQ